MRKHMQHILKNDDTTFCGLTLTRTSAWYWYRKGTPRPVRDWLIFCSRCAAKDTVSP